MSIEYECRKCGSKKLVKNGKTPAGRQKFHCKSCDFYSTLEPFEGYWEERKEEILRAYEERSSSRGIRRTFGISRTTLFSWIKKKEKIDISKTLAEPEDREIIELDELWSYVGKKSNKQWLWLALCRRTRQKNKKELRKIVAQYPPKLPKKGEICDWFTRKLQKHNSKIKTHPNPKTKRQNHSYWAKSG